jgi:hypothetical protein
MVILESWTEKRKDGRGSRSFCMARCGCGHVGRYDKSNILRGNTSKCKECSNKSRSSKHSKHKMSESFKADNPLGYATYCVYKTMKARCSNVKNAMYENYGGRGIKVCERWLNSYDNFILDMGIKPTMKHQIERIDNDGNYCPENCKWATPEENARNKRNTFFITVDGKTKTSQEWSEISGVNFRTIKKRIQQHGWTERDAVFTPAKPGRGK